MKGFLIRGWDYILPGCGGTWTLSRGGTLDARRLHEPQSKSNQPVGLGFPHRAVTRVVSVFVPGCGRTSKLAPGATLAAR